MRNDTIGTKAVRVAEIVREKKGIIERAENGYCVGDSETIIQNNTEKLKKAKKFLKELEDASIYGFEHVHVLSKTQFRKKLEEADFSNVELEGEFVQIYLVANYPYGNTFIACTKPLAEIK